MGLFLFLFSSLNFPYLVTLKGNFNRFSHTKLRLCSWVAAFWTAAFTEKVAMKKRVERNLLQALMMEVEGGFNIALLLRRPPGDTVLSDLSRSLLGCCHEESTRAPAFSLLMCLPLSCSLAELSSTRGGCLTHASVTLRFTQHGPFRCCSFARSRSWGRIKLLPSQSCRSTPVQAGLVYGRRDCLALSVQLYA